MCGFILQNIQRKYKFPYHSKNTLIYFCNNPIYLSMLIIHKLVKLSGGASRLIIIGISDMSNKIITWLVEGLSEGRTLEKLDTMQGQNGQFYKNVQKPNLWEKISFAPFHSLYFNYENQNLCLEEEREAWKEKERESSSSHVILHVRELEIFGGNLAYESAHHHNHHSSSKQKSRFCSKVWFIA